jgi:hypothetical protein
MEVEGVENEEENPDSPLVYLTSIVEPTHLPTTTVTVDQTVLPYVLTQDPEGNWRRVNNAWSLYGREAGVSCGQKARLTSDTARWSASRWRP